jgi:tetratricopeptide (TPR) repeat protein
MSDKTTRLERAREAIRQRDFASAYAQYNALLATYPDDADILREYGRGRYKEYADLQQATQLFERARAADPQSVETLLWLGDLYSLGYGPGYSRAADVYRMAIKLDPKAVDAHIGLGLLHRAPSKQVTLDEAIAAFRAAAEINPQRADAHINLGMALIEAGRRDAAATELRAAQQLLMVLRQQRQARGIQSVLERLATDEPIKSLAYSNQSPRYR